MFLQVLKMIFFDMLGVMFLAAAFVFLIYTLLTLGVLARGIFDKSLRVSDRLWLTFIMAIGLLWGCWMVHFSYSIGMSCLTY